MTTLGDDVQFEAMVHPGESVDSYMERLRDLARDADGRFEAAVRELVQSRKELETARREGASLKTITDAMDATSVAARKVGSARYRKQSCEFFIQDAIHRITG
jgi:hypothetical protein